MSENIPSQNEEPICKCKALYLGTSVFNQDNKKVNESNLNLAQLQHTIAERYPIDGSNYAQGIQTWLTIFPSGLQMEHASFKKNCSISALFYYPIKSLVYCGALRFTADSEDFTKNSQRWKFVPLDTETAQKTHNSRNPPLFVVFLKAIDPNTKKQVIECQVFVIGMIKTAMKLIESCQKAFNSTRQSIGDFYKKFSNIPVVYCMRTDLDNGDKRVLVKKFDQNGYFYATENTPIDLWQLFDEDENLYESMAAVKHQVTNQVTRSDSREPLEQIYSQIKPKKNEKKTKSDKIKYQAENNEDYDDKMGKVCQENESFLDPYEKTENLIKVEKRIDPVTGQNIYVRYLAEPKSSLNKNYDLPEKIYDNNSDHNFDNENKKNRVFVRNDKTPSPIIVEKYVKKKAPQVIIKEIHVHEPAPPPVKIIQSMNNQFEDNRLPILDNSYDSKQPPNVLGPMAQIYQGPCSTIRPTKGPVIKLINPNNVPINDYNSKYTSVKNLLNKAYGPSTADNHNTDNHQINSWNRNYDMGKNQDIQYRRLANPDNYDYNMKPKRLFNETSIYPKNYSTVRSTDTKRYLTGYPRNGMI